MEEGTTTTPFDMMLVNHVSRFHIAQFAVTGGALKNEKVRIRQQELLAELGHDITATKKYIIQNRKGKWNLSLIMGYVIYRSLILIF
jgi:xylulose-5-phosphate/fructose-6-phosphate phosphoketolase